MKNIPWLVIGIIASIGLIAGCGTVQDKTTDSASSKQEISPVGLHVGIQGAGNVEISPVQASYMPGTQITIIPQAELGWAFYGRAQDWIGDVSHNVFIIQKETYVTVNFSPLS